MAMHTKPSTPTMMTTTMNDTTALLRLMSWLSPVFPTGSFAYSSGLEQAVSDGIVSDADTLNKWVSCLLIHGSIWNDAVIFMEAHRLAKANTPMHDLASYALALTSSAQRRAETISQGTSFVEGALNWMDQEQLPARGTPLPVCVGNAAASAHINAKQAVSAYLHAFVTNQLQAAIRLSVTGQNGAARTLAQLEQTIEQAANRAAASTLDDLGNASIMADIAAMSHETLQPRLFLS